MPFYNRSIVGSWVMPNGPLADPKTLRAVDSSEFSRKQLEGEIERRWG